MHMHSTLREEAQVPASSQWSLFQLQSTVRLGKLDKVKQLVEAMDTESLRSSLQRNTTSYSSPILEACEGGHVDVLEYLLPKDLP